jgi:hypothetical protein
MEPILRDFRLALSRLRMAPGFTLFAVVSLALGIGVSTAIYSAVRTFFWMPLGVADQKGLVALTSGRVTTAMFRLRDASADAVAWRRLVSPASAPRPRGRATANAVRLTRGGRSPSCQLSSVVARPAAVGRKRL